MPLVCWQWNLIFEYCNILKSCRRVGQYIHCRWEKVTNVSFCHCCDASHWSFQFQNSVSEFFFYARHYFDISSKRRTNDTDICWTEEKKRAIFFFCSVLPIAHLVTIRIHQTEIFLTENHQHSMFEMNERKLITGLIFLVILVFTSLTHV